MPEINLKRNILLSGSSRIVVMLVSFLTGWISTRFLGVEFKGQYSYLITISSFTWLVLDLGLHKTFPYLLRRDMQKRNILFTWSVMQFVFEFILLASAGLLFMDFFSAMLKFRFAVPTMLLLTGAITLTKLSQQMQMYYLGLDKVKLNSIYQITSSLAMLLMVGFGYLAMRGSQRLLYVLASYDLAMLISVLCFTHRQLLTRFWKGFSLKFIFSSYGYGWRVFLSSLFISLLIRFDVVLIRHYLGFAELGIYSVAAGIVDMLQMASNLVGSLLLVKLSDMKDDIQRWELMKKLFIVFLLLLGTANLGFVLLGKPLLGLMYGKSFIPVYPVYLWLIPASFGLSFGSMFNTYLWSKGFPLICVLLPLIALLVNIGLNLFLIPALGIRGASLSTSIAYVLWFVMILLYEQKISGNTMLRHLMPRTKDFSAVLRSLWTTVVELSSRLGLSQKRS